MEVLAQTIVADDKDTWSIVVIPDELYVYIGCAPCGATPDPLIGQTVKELLVWLPQDTLHKQAHSRFIEMLMEFLQGTS